MASNKINLLIILLFSVAVSYAGPDNIAGKAKVTVSSQLNNQTSGNNAVDGIIGVEDIGEWACQGVTTDWGYIRFPWIQLNWSQPQIVNRIVLYDRPSPDENIAGGKLVFSDGTEQWVNQLPADGTGKAIYFPNKTVNWVRFVVTDGTGSNLGLSEIEVFAAPSQFDEDYVSWVDPYIETNRGRYFFFITGSTPFGMASSAPLTRNKNQNGGGYNYNEREILGFEQIHSWMVSGIEIMPATAAEKPSLGQKGWKSFFNHDDEIVQPGYHRVMLQQHKIWVEQSATERVNFYRFIYTKNTDARIIINLGGYVGNSTMEDASFTKISETELEGSFSSNKRYWGGPKEVRIFFVVRFDQPFSGLDMWKGQQHVAGVTSGTGDSLVITAAYPMKKGAALQMKIGLSYTSIENARNNLLSECKDWNFDAVRKNTQSIWNEWLGRIAVKTDVEANKVKFYTDLWHVLLGRQKISDINGDYPDRTTGRREGNFTHAEFKVKTVPKDAAGKPMFHMYNSDAWWLTQWNLNILWGLAWPEMMDEFSASMIEFANNGYLLPRGPSGGGYSYIMTSCPASNLIVSTFMKGLLTKVDPRHAYEVVKRNHMPGGMLGAKEDVEFYIKKGWWPDNAGITIEASFQDWGIAQMASRLGRKKDFQYFSKRARNWLNNFDSTTKWILPKDKKGNFVHRDLLSGSGWVEANAWQGSFGISHDLPKLMELMGGVDSFTHRLNYAFEQSRSSNFVFSYTDGYVSYANQPGCSNAHVFSYAGKPWLTQYWVRRVRQHAYRDTSPDMGYGGHDEDQGQMGGVSALMSIGLFNVTGNQSAIPVYEITSPIFDEVVIKLDGRYYNGGKFSIVTHHNSPKNDYIQSAKLNGNSHSNFWFTHADFSKGGTLELWLGDTANEQWGVGPLPPTSP